MVNMLTLSAVDHWFESTSGQTRIRAAQSLLFLLSTAGLAGKQQKTNFIVFGLTRCGLEPMIYCTQGEHVNHYTTNAVIFTLENKIILK
jgi:hypothetical protein